VKYYLFAISRRLNEKELQISKKYVNKVFLFINFAKVTNDKNMVLGYFKHELLDEVQTQSVHCCADY